MPPEPLLAIAMIILSLTSPAKSAARATSILCNSKVYAAGDPFAGNLAYVLADWVEGGSAQPGKVYYSVSPFPIAFAYGSASCSGNLTAGDCRDCLRSAVAEVTVACQAAIGGRASLGDCAVRYEKYAFV